jgi:hypothetical protein
LNQNGDKYASLLLPYDKFEEIISVDGSLYDERGKRIRRLKKEEIRDISSGAFTYEFDVDDTRYKIHDFHCKTYPYTVEYEWEEKYFTSQYFPPWNPQEGYAYAVQESSFSVIYPSDYVIRYKAINYKGEPEKSVEKGKNVNHWKLDNLEALDYEVFSPPFEKLTTIVYIAPTKFKVENYEGDMSTWETWGKFIFMLKQNRDELPLDVKDQVHRMTDYVGDVREKIRMLYEYLQRNTRYISIQIGIGGWQPFDAKFVASKKYGDCKALSNFMFALLKEAGIPSYYCVIQAGAQKSDMIADFPCHQFNHATLCVPLNKDTLWLECTSQDVPMGYIGSFTGNRHALLISEKGGVVVSTTRYGSKENLRTRFVKAVVDNAGKLDLTSATRMRAMEGDQMHFLINHNSRDKVTESLKESLELPTYDITRMDYAEDKESIPTLTMTIGVTASGYAQVTEKRMFINPNVLNRHNQVLTTDSARRFPIYMREDSRQMDTVEISLPPGYAAESVPGPVSLENEFGKYASTVKVLGDKIVYYRFEEKHAGLFPAASYDILVKYYGQIRAADYNKVVLVKK